MAILIKTDNTIQEVKPKNGKSFSLKELQSFVGGLVEMVSMPSGKEIIVNEEGKVIGLSDNKIATLIWKKEFPIKEYPENNDEWIAGNALIVENLKEIE